MLFHTVFALAAIAGVSAHGWVNRLTIAGKTYNGPYPFDNKPAASIIRQITTTSPIRNAMDGNMHCGLGSKKAALVAPANPGDKITISWRSTATKNWGHTLGPILTYLAQVPGGQTADKFDSKNANFFKIAQTGQTGGAGSGWAMAGIKKGNTYSFNLPSNLPAGDYLIRHEFIALHFAHKDRNGAQFFPMCAQIRVGGGSKSPKAVAGAQTVKFPGGYTPGDKSLYVPNLFKNNFKYTMPGPALYKAKSARDETSAVNATAIDVDVVEEEDDDDEEEETKRSVIVPEAHRRMVNSRKARLE